MNELQAKLRQIISKTEVETIRNSLAELEVKTDEKGKRTFKVIASTEAVDRAWETIKADGWKWENFMKNPVILANHRYSVENIVGKATKIYVKDKKLIIEWVFSESNPLGKLVADLYEEGMLKAVSVWFLVLQRDEKNRDIIIESELLECSFVAVPCNYEALSQDQKELYKKGLEAGIIKETEENNNEKEKNLEKKIDDLTTLVVDLKAEVKSLVDGNTKKKQEADYQMKENLQAISRVANDWLAQYKKSLKG